MACSRRCWTQPVGGGNRMIPGRDGMLSQVLDATCGRRGWNSHGPWTGRHAPTGAGRSLWEGRLGLGQPAESGSSSVGNREYRAGMGDWDGAHMDVDPWCHAWGAWWCWLPHKRWGVVPFLVYWHPIGDARRMEDDEKWIGVNERQSLGVSPCAGCGAGTWEVDEWWVEGWDRWLVEEY
jgi:hypothetical protein